MRLIDKVRKVCASDYALVHATYDASIEDITRDDDDYRLHRMPDTTLGKLASRAADEYDTEAVIRRMIADLEDGEEDNTSAPIYVWDGYILADKETRKRWPVTVYVPSWWQ